jgi:hypothetical protein
MDITQIPITLTMPVAAVNLIVTALGKLPHDEVSELIVGIRRISLQQIQQHQEAEAEKAQAETVAAAPADSEGGEQ